MKGREKIDGGNTTVQLGYMKAEAIIDVYKERFRKISRHRDRLLKDFEAGEIHRFRVEVKKLRAFMRLLNAADGSHKSKLPHNVKSFYRMLGLLRNLQLYQLRLTSLCDDLSIDKPLMHLQSLHEEEKTLRLAISQVADSFSWKVVEKEIMSKSPSQLTGKSIKAFIRQSKTKLQELLSLPDYYEDAFHKIRKLLKDLMYDSKYIATALTMSLPRELRSLKSLEPLTIALGEVYDFYGALNLLSTGTATTVNDENELGSLASLKQHLQLRKEKMKQEVIFRLLPLKEGISGDITV
jgi:CHAD domain-containing protein